MNSAQRLMFWNPRNLLAMRSAHAVMASDQSNLGAWQSPSLVASNKHLGLSSVWRCSSGKHRLVCVPRETTMIGATLVPQPTGNTFQACNLIFSPGEAICTIFELRRPLSNMQRFPSTIWYLSAVTSNLSQLAYRLVVKTSQLLLWHR